MKDMSVQKYNHLVTKNQELMMQRHVKIMRKSEAEEVLVCYTLSQTSGRTRSEPSSS